MHRVESSVSSTGDCREVLVLFRTYHAQNASLTILPLSPEADTTAAEGRAFRGCDNPYFSTLCVLLDRKTSCRDTFECITRGCPGHATIIATPARGHPDLDELNAQSIGYTNCSDREMRLQLFEPGVAR